MVAALLALLTIWVTPSGDVFYVKHCRSRKEGCVAYVSQFVANARTAGDAHGVPATLLAATAFRESGLNREAISSTGDRSEYQLNPRRALLIAKGSWLYNEDPGAAYAMVAASELAAGKEKCGTWELAASYYHSGKCLKNHAYSKRVMRLARKLRDW